jgi:HNH endonuclease
VKLPKELRQQVLERAKGNCEYCLLPQIEVPFSHEVDHIIARQHGGTDALENLALCCIFCNRPKGPNLATFDPGTEDITLLFNPRKQVWSEHFSLEQGNIVGVTKEGRATVFLLRFNDEIRIAQRQQLIGQGRYNTLL